MLFVAGSQKNGREGKNHIAPGRKSSLVRLVFTAVWIFVPRERSCYNLQLSLETGISTIMESAWHTHSWSEREIKYRCLRIGILWRLLSIKRFAHKYCACQCVKECIKHKSSVQLALSKWAFRRYLGQIGTVSFAKMVSTFRSIQSIFHGLTIWDFLSFWNKDMKNKFLGTTRF